MDDQDVLAVGCDAPVEPPFQHGQGLIPGEWREGFDGVDDEAGLGAQPSAQAVAGLDRHMEIHKPGVVNQRMVGVETGQFRGNLRDTALQSAVEGAGGQTNAIAGQTFTELGGGKRTDFQWEVAWIRRASSKASRAVRTWVPHSAGSASGSSCRTAWISASSES